LRGSGGMTVRGCGKYAALLWVGMILMAACAPVGPDYQQTEPAVPSAYSAVETGISTCEQPGPCYCASWWEVLQDPVLDELMTRAVTGNLDVHMARARVQQARALAGVSEARLLPEGGPQGSYDVYRRSDAMVPTQGSSATPTAFRRRGELYEVGFDASWEIDIFGGVRREIEAADADLAAAGEALRDTLVTLQGEVARNYMELRGEQLRMDIAQREVESRRTNASITESRFNAGLVSHLELARAQGEEAVAEARIPSIENAILAAVHRLSVLLGRDPANLTSSLSPPAALPKVPDDLPAGLPSELLRQRPDIRKAERELAAATARIGVSTADLFPRFSLTGYFGYLDDDLESLSWRSGHFWGIGPSIRWPVLNFKRILSNIAAKEAVRDEALARYEAVVLLSLEEVENALVVLSREKRRAASLAVAVTANDEALKLARELYTAGAESYLAILDAESALFNAEDELAQSRINRAVGFVSLYKALGGGWQGVEAQAQRSGTSGKSDTLDVQTSSGG